MRKQEQDARNRAREAAEKQQPAADSVQPDLVDHACRLHARGAPVKVVASRASDNENYGNPAATRSGANPPARSGPDSLTFSRPPRTNPRPRSAADLRPQPGRYALRQAKTGGRCMFMQPLQSEPGRARSRPPGTRSGCPVDSRTEPANRRTLPDLHLALVFPRRRAVRYPRRGRVPFDCALR